MKIAKTGLSFSEAQLLPTTPGSVRIPDEQADRAWATIQKLARDEDDARQIGIMLGVVTA